MTNANKKVLISLVASLVLIIPSLYLLDSNYAPAKAERLSSNIPLEILDENKFKEDYIYVDLSKMILSTYKGGTKLNEYKIISKGKPGSYYETPSGNYEVMAMMGDKLSTLGNVYMPNSIQFWGNFFIHGIPYHPDGEKVSSTYSGGCIRLSDEDSKEVYDFVKKGDKVLVVNSDTNSDPNQNSNIQDYNKDYGATTTRKLFDILLSLDIYNQEKIIYYDGKEIKNLKLIEYALKGDDKAYAKIVSNLANSTDITKYKIEKARALGLTNIEFENINDRLIISNYIYDSKRYLTTFIN